MSIKNFIKRLLVRSRYTFYMNDKIIDLEVIEDSEIELDNYEFEDNCIRLYSSKY